MSFDFFVDAKCVNVFRCEVNSSDLARQIISTAAQRFQNQLYICLTFRAVIKQPEYTNSLNQVRACSLDALLGISMKMILYQSKSNICFHFLNFSEDAELCLKCGQTTQLADDCGRSLRTLHFLLCSTTVTG
jgi:hypothetical protein